MIIKIKYIILISFFTLLANGITAQITVGSLKDPEPFSILEIDGKWGGMKIPKIQESDKTAMEGLFNAESDGLIVFNETSGKIEFWNGSEWITFTNNLIADNGLTAIVDTLKLGGDLTNPVTELDLDNFNLNIKNSSASELAINDTMVVVNNRIVSILPATKFSVNDTVIDIRDKYVDLRPASFSVNDDAFSMSGPGRTSINGSFALKDGTENTGYLLTTDENGNASWGALRPMGSISTGALKNDVPFASTSVNITLSSITLTPGQWLIMARYTGRMNPSMAGMYHWITLSSRSTNIGSASDTGYSSIGMTGMNPEARTAGTGVYSYSTPSIVHYVNITQETEFAIFAGTSNSTTLASQTSSDYGGGSFFAIRLDIPIE